MQSFHLGGIAPCAPLQVRAWLAVCTLAAAALQHFFSVTTTGLCTPSITSKWTKFKNDTSSSVSNASIRMHSRGECSGIRTFENSCHICSQYQALKYHSFVFPHQKKLSSAM